MLALTPTREIAPRQRYAATFFTECFIDELARAAWRDPVQYRREMLPGTSRLRRVLDEAARISGWSRPLPVGRSRGIALSVALGAVAAHVAEMSVDDQGEPRVHRIVAVIDCGSGAPAEAARRRLHQSLHDRWGGSGVHVPQFDLRFLPSEAPAVSVEEAAAGAAPAVANALAVLQGRRGVERLLS